MLRYSLHCETGHGFESWFRDSATCDAQMAQGLVACPVCGGTKLEKAIMAPAIARRDRDAKPPAQSEPRAVALISEEEKTARQMLKALREHVTAHADDVGDRFAHVARQMHEGEIDKRSIYGVAAPEEVRALHEDGVEAYPLPVLPDEAN